MITKLTEKLAKEIAKMSDEEFEENCKNVASLLKKTKKMKHKRNITELEISHIAKKFVENLNYSGIKAKKRETKNGIFIYGEKNKKGGYLYETYISYENNIEESLELLQIEEFEFKRLHKNKANTTI